MKKKILLTLITGLTLLLLGCSNNSAGEEQPDLGNDQAITEDITATPPSSEDATATPPSEDTTATPPSDQSLAPEAPGDEVPMPEDGENMPSLDAQPSDTIGGQFLASFEAIAAESPSLNAEDFATSLVVQTAIDMNLSIVPVEEGLLSGFNNAEIKGFTDGCMFGPMIGAIPFVGYVFITDSAESAQTLQSLLIENGDPRWNVCTEAEETVTSIVDNKVLFLMCPRTL